MEGVACRRFCLAALVGVAMACVRGVTFAVFCAVYMANAQQILEEYCRVMVLHMWGTEDRFLENCCSVDEVHEPDERCWPWQEFNETFCCKLAWKDEDSTDSNWQPSGGDCQSLCDRPGESLQGAFSKSKAVEKILHEASNTSLLRITTQPETRPMTYKYSLLSALDHPSLGTPLCLCAPGTTIVRQCVGCRPFSRAAFLDLQTSPKAKIRFLATKLAEVVAYLHHSPMGPVVHNDLIDRNVLVNFETAALMLIDFDSAIVLPNMGARVRAEMGRSGRNLDRDLGGPVEGVDGDCATSRPTLKLGDVYATYDWRTTHEDLDCHGIAVERDLFSLGQLYLTVLDGTHALPVRWRTGGNVSFQIFGEKHRTRRRVRWSLVALTAMTGFKRILHNQFSFKSQSLAQLLLSLLGPLPRPSAHELARSLPGLPAPPGLQTKIPQEDHRSTCAWSCI